MKHNLAHFFKAFAFAWAGLIRAIREERNLRFHLCFAAFVVAAAIICGDLSTTELSLLALSIASVISAELMNSAVERAVGLASPERNPMAGAAKDMAAGAVLVCALGAVTVGVIVFVLSGRFLLLWSFFRGSPMRTAILLASICAAFWLIFCCRTSSLHD